MKELAKGLDLVVPLRQRRVILLSHLEGHAVREAALAKLHQVCEGMGPESLNGVRGKVLFREADQPLREAALEGGLVGVAHVFVREQRGPQEELKRAPLLQPLHLDLVRESTAIQHPQRDVVGVVVLGLFLPTRGLHVPAHGLGQGIRRLDAPAEDLLFVNLHQRHDVVPRDVVQHNPFTVVHDIFEETDVGDIVAAVRGVGVVPVNGEPTLQLLCDPLQVARVPRHADHLTGAAVARGTTPVILCRVQEPLRKARWEIPHPSSHERGQHPGDAGAGERPSHEGAHVVNPRQQLVRRVVQKGVRDLL
eukprot:RCo018000